MTDSRIDAPIVAGMAQLTSYDEINEVLTSRKFLQGGNTMSGQQLMRDVLPLLDGERHMKRKRLISRLFNDDSVESYRERHLFPVIEHSLAEIAALPRSPAGLCRVDLVPLVQRCLYRVAAAVSGVDGLETMEAAERLVDQAKTMVAGMTVEWSREDPEIVLQRAFAAQDAFRREFFQPSYDRRAQLLATQGSLEPADVMTLILTNRSDAWAGDDDLPLREIALFLVSATQTTAGGLVSLILRLEKWFAAHPADRRLLADDPGFLRRAAFDSLRLTVAAPARIRTATEDVRLATGRQIRAGEKVALLFIPANTDADRFGADATDFNPHRLAPASPPWGLAFGAGAHSCPGRPLVTGGRSLSGEVSVDGTMVAISRRFYAAGLRLDDQSPPIRDEATFYDLYTKVPVIFEF